MPNRVSQHHARDASAGAITAAGDTGALPNLAAGPRATIVVLFDVGTLSSGASIVPQLDTSIDGVNWFKVAAFATINTSNTNNRLVVNDVLEPQVRVSWPLPGGTTPSIGSVAIDLLFL